MKFTLMITTLNRSNEFKRMVESLLGQNLNFLRKIIVLDQSVDAIFTKNNEVLDGIPKSVKIIHKSISKTSLSHARNQALQFLESDDEIICFPDDDCWYPQGFFLGIYNQLSNHDIDIIQTYYREPEIEGRKPPEVLINRNNVRFLHPCSVGIFINLEKVCKSNIFFDEILGVGTDLPGAEESDLLFRLLLLNHNIKQICEPYVYHKVIRERLKKPSYKVHAARFYVMLKNKKLKDVHTRLVLSFLKSLLVVFLDYRNLFGKVYALQLWIKNKNKI